MSMDECAYIDIILTQCTAYRYDTYLFVWMNCDMNACERTVLCDNVHADAHICTTYGAHSSWVRGSKAYTDVMFMYMYEYTL